MNGELRRKIFWIGALFAVSMGVWLFFDFNVWRPNLQTLGLAEVRIGKNVVLAEIADTPDERGAGLSGRDGLESGRGMLFLFYPPARQEFWMKDMKFPIDIIWIRDGRVIGFEENVPAPRVGTSDSLLPVYSSPKAVDVVLEVGAGEVKRLNIEIGDVVKVVR